MRILLCCAGGFSTNMLMQNMKKVVKESAKLNEEDFKFTAIPADSLEEEIDNWDRRYRTRLTSSRLYANRKTCRLQSLTRMYTDRWTEPPY